MQPNFQTPCLCYVQIINKVGWDHGYSSLFVKIEKEIEKKVRKDT